MSNSFINGEGLSKGLLQVSFSAEVVENLHPNQKLILYYLTVCNMTPKEIKNKKNTTIQAVRNTIKKLRDKGLIDKLNRPNTDVENLATPYNSNEGGYSLSHPKNSTKKYRLHGQNIVLKILKTSKQYWNLLEKNTQMSVKGNTIQIHRRKVVIYSNTSFYSDDVDDCFEQANNYWTQFFRTLENNLSVKLVDNKYSQIYQFRCHIGKVGDPLAKQVIKNKLNFVVSDDLGRVRLHIDNSKGLFELEAVDNKLCQDDMRTIGNFQMDLLNLPEELKMSDVMDFMKNSTSTFSELQKEMLNVKKEENHNQEKLDKMEKMLEQMVEIQNHNSVLVMKLSENIEKMTKERF